MKIDVDIGCCMCSHPLAMVGQRFWIMNFMHDRGDSGLKSCSWDYREISMMDW